MNLGNRCFLILLYDVMRFRKDDCSMKPFGFEMNVVAFWRAEEAKIGNSPPPTFEPGTFSEPHNQRAKNELQPAFGGNFDARPEHQQQ